MASPGAIAASGRWSNWKRAGVTTLVIAGAAIGALLADVLFHIRPIAAEKFWLAGLSFGTKSLQEEATFRLRNYPTRDAATSLVAYIHAKSRAGDLKLAARAAETLCILTGRTFGAPLQEPARGHIWRRPDEVDWPEVLRQIDLWAERALVR